VLDVSSVVGNLKVYHDRLTVSNPSVLWGSIRANISVKRGKWYYEVELATQGLFQIGWVTSRCQFRPFEGYGYGVGDDEYSWAVDFQRGLLHFITFDSLSKCCHFILQQIAKMLSASNFDSLKNLTSNKTKFSKNTIIQ
jgi:hypothetical protein